MSIKLQSLSHKSQNLHKLESLTASTFIFEQNLISELDKLIKLFKSEFGSLRNAELNFETSDIACKIVAEGNPTLENFAAQVNSALANGYGYAVIKDLPYEENEQLPLFILGLFLGTPRYNNRDRVYLWPVTPKFISSSKVHKGNERFVNADVGLAYHCDTSCVAGLLCVRPAGDGGENSIISTVELHNEILNRDIESLKFLYQPAYIDRMGEQLDGELPYANLPVFALENEKLLTHWADIYHYTIYDKFPELAKLDPKHFTAYESLKTAIKNVSSEKKLSIGLQAGELLLMNNNLVFHNREPFRNDSSTRLLYRIWLTLKEYPSFPHMFGYK